MFYKMHSSQLDFCRLSLAIALLISRIPDFIKFNSILILKETYLGLSLSCLSFKHQTVLQFSRNSQLQFLV